MQELYTVSQASQATGIAKPTLRGYTRRYQRFLSTEATPEHGVERLFTESDLKVLAFIFSYTSAGKTHDQAMQALQAGELDQFSWQPPQEPETPDQPSESYSAALVPVERLQALDTLRQNAEQREAEALARLEQAQEQIRELERKLGQAQGELAGVRSSQYRAPKWWRSIFGGQAEK